MFYHFLVLCLYICKTRLCRLIKKNLPQCNLKTICRSNCRLQNLFQFKDRIPKYLHSGLVCKFTCDSCNAIYYGKTLRHFKVRVSEHLGVSARTEKRVKVFNTTAVRDHSLFCKEARSDNFEILCYESNNFNSV